MKRLLFITPTSSLKAGGEISNVELIKYGLENGYSIFAVVPEKGELSTKLKSIGVKVFNIPYGWWGPDITPSQVGLSGLKAAQAMSRIIKDNSIDCVITNTLNIPWGSIAAAKTNTPHIWIAREFPFEEFSYLKDRYKFVESFSNIVMANSKNVAQYMIDSENIKNINHFYSFVKVEDISLKSNGKETPIRLVNVGNIEPRKNQHSIIKALSTMKDPPILPEVILIGNISDQNYYNKIVNDSQKYNINLSVLPFQKKPWSQITKKDIFIQSSLSESIGRSTTEAMKLGLITVGADIPGTQEAFQLGGGFLYKHNSLTELSQLLQDILKRPSYYQKKAQLFQKRALKNMSWQNCNSPFYVTVDNIIGSDNPQFKSSLLFEYVEKAINSSETEKAEELAKQGSVIKDQLQKIQLLESELANIKSSKIYKSLAIARKIRHKLK